MTKKIIVAFVAAMLAFTNILATPAAVAAECPLCDPAYNGEITEVKRLIAAGADVNAKNEYSLTALMYAVSGASADEVVKILLDAGADVNAKNEFDWTALMGAASKGHAETAKILLDAGADVNVKDNENGETAADMAKSQGHPELANFITNYNVANSSLIEELRNGTLKEVKRLVAAGANVNEKNKNGETVLMWAVLMGDADIIKILLDKGANVNAKDEDGDTALMLAASKGYSGSAKILLDNGAEVHAKNAKGNTAMWLATFDGYSDDTIRVLLQAGADANTKTEENWTVLMEAVSQEDFQTVEALLKANVNVNAKSINNDTALRIAVLKNSYIPEFIEILLDNGADVNAKGLNGRMIWAEAASEFMFENSEFTNVASVDERILNRLLSKARVSADPSIWFEVATLGDYILIEMLLSAGFSVNTKDKNGWTALMLSAQDERTKAVKTLLEFGANADATNNRGETAAEIASGMGHKKLVGLIKSYADFKPRLKPTNTADDLDESKL